MDAKNQQDRAKMVEEAVGRMLVQRMRSGNWIEKTWKEEFHLRMWQIWTLRIVPNLEALELHLQMAA